VIALVEWIKKFGAEGAVLNAISMAVGALIGVAYWYAQSPLASFADWFGAVIYGLALGLVASGIYDATKSAVRG
jgi:hypothetical protein